jgi:hypothetical protein
LFAVLAQLVEHSAVNRAVAGSSPADGVTLFFSCWQALKIQNYEGVLYPDVQISPLHNFITISFFMLFLPNQNKSKGYG